MIYITGDCHCNFERFGTKNFPEQKEMTKDDYVIICGDFGGIWDKGWEPYRINHVSWWAQEMPSKEEMEEGRRNLAKHGNCVDFIVTHCCSSGTQAILGGGMFTPDGLTKYFQELRETVQFKKWFYNLFIAEEAINSDTYHAGQMNKNQFMDDNGLNMELVLKKFVQHFTESFSGSTDKFIEDNGRKLARYNCAA